MDFNFTRRKFVGALGSLTALSFLGRKNLLAAGTNPLPTPSPTPAGAGSYVPVEALGTPTLPFSLVKGVKVFQLQAGPVTVTWPDGSDPMMVKRRPINVWGYNGTMIGPTIEAVEGDTVRILFTNNLPEATTVHWHGLEIPIAMDGVPSFSQDPVLPGGTFTYEFTLNQSGTYFYHSHTNTMKQVGLGLMGFFIVHPKNPEPYQVVDRDYAVMLHTWKIDPGSSIPDIMEMTEFNYFTMNGRVGEGEGSTYGIPPMRAKVGEKVRIRVTNLSMLSHPIHLHGHSFSITDWGAGFLPPSQWIKANTISVSAAEVRTLEFTARAPGKWMFHCHFTHHTMNDMHRPVLPGDPSMSDMPAMDMGGMSTWIEVT